MQVIKFHNYDSTHSFPCDIQISHQDNNIPLTLIDLPITIPSVRMWAQTTLLTMGSKHRVLSGLTPPEQLPTIRGKEHAGNIKLARGRNAGQLTL